MRTWMLVALLMLGAGLMTATTNLVAQPVERADPPPAMIDRPPPEDYRPPTGDYRDWHWRMMQEGWHGGFGYGHWGFSLLFWVLIVGALVLAARAAVSRGGDGSRVQGPREVLDARYARGEIDREEYLRQRRDLES